MVVAEYPAFFRLVKSPVFCDEHVAKRDINRFAETLVFDMYAIPAHQRPEPFRLRTAKKKPPESILLQRCAILPAILAIGLCVESQKPERTTSDLASVVLTLTDRDSLTRLSSCLDQCRKKPSRLGGNNGRTLFTLGALHPGEAGLREAE